MQGELGVESELGEGSNFWFEIELAAHTDMKRNIPPVDVTGAKVLVVDDNTVNRTILAEQMQAWQFESVGLGTGEEVIPFLTAAYAQGLEIDCIVLDYHMPRMNGVDVVNAIHEDGRFSDIPVVMLTSVNETDDHRTFSSLGIQGHLVKPARSALLLETLISVMREDRANKASPNETVAVSSQEPVAAPTPMTETATSEGIDVLVCEDNEVNRIVISQVLEAMGVRFEMAINGRQGVEFFKKHQPSMIIMDVSMPEMNGLEATAAIREIEAETGQHTPILGVTAHAIVGDEAKCLEAGMDDYLTKPVSPDTLTMRVTHWLGTVKAKSKSVG